MASYLVIGSLAELIVGQTEHSGSNRVCSGSNLG